MRTFQIIKLLGLLLALFIVSCDESEEILEQQEVQSNISEALSVEIKSNLESNIAFNSAFNELYWYENYELNGCDEDLAFIQFDAKFKLVNGEWSTASSLIYYEPGDYASFNEMFVQAAQNMSPIVAGGEIDFENFAAYVNLIGIMKYTDGGTLHANLTTTEQFEDFFDNCCDLDNSEWEFLSDDGTVNPPAGLTPPGDDFNWYENYTPSSCTDEEILNLQFFFQFADVSGNWVDLYTTINYNPAENLTFQELFQAALPDLANYPDIQIDESNVVAYIYAIWVTKPFESLEYGTVELNTTAQYEAFFGNCEIDLENATWIEQVGIGDSNPDPELPTEPCSEFVYPLTVLAVDLTSETQDAYEIVINSNEELFSTLFESTEIVVIDFVYPINVTVDGENQEINNIDELSAALATLCE